MLETYMGFSKSVRNQHENNNYVRNLHILLIFYNNAVNLYKSNTSYMNKSISPFIGNLVIPYREYNQGFDESTQEPIKTYEVEAERHCRIYNDRARRLYMYSLSIYARDIFMALQYFTYNDNHYIVLSYEKMKELLGENMYGKRRFEDSVRELIKHSILDYKDREKHQYWYNPAYYSPGNRLRIFPEAQKYKVN